ncbi:MAG: ADYC domain-containing protein [Archangium sp.]
MKRGLAMLVVVFSSCGVESITDQSGAPVAQVRQAGFERQGFERQGFERQGFERQGYELGIGAIKGFSLRSLLRAQPSLADRAELKFGELVVKESPYNGTAFSLSPCQSTTYGEWRGCGWAVAASGQCTPSSQVTVRDYSNIDSMLAACSGTYPCDSAFLAHNDDYMGLQARVAFTCPSSGQFLIMAAAYSSSQSLNLSLSATNATFPFLVDRNFTANEFSAVDFNGNAVPARILSVVPEISRAQLTANNITAPVRTDLPNVKRYEVQVRNANTGTWEHLCGEDFDARKVAVATPGWWDATATRKDEADGNLFTFSCSRGVITKCHRWGYYPYADLPGTGGTLTDSQARTLFQTCTRAARADYCGDGNSWTDAGTLINIDDDVPVQVSSPAAEVAANGLSFEAGWLPTGAACLSHTRWVPTPDYLKFENCPKLYDYDPAQGAAAPRIPRECNDRPAARQRGSLIFDDSALNQIGP